MAGELTNPFDSTFELLQVLREEIQEVRLAIVDECHERAQETSDLRQIIIELQHSKNDKFDQVCNTVEELRAQKTARFDKIEAYVEELRHTKTQRFEILDSKVETEINHREHSCRALDKTIQVEVAHILSFIQKIDKQIVDHKKIAELVHTHVKSAHEELVVEVDRLGCILRDNTMTRDPMKHFARRPGSSQHDTQGMVSPTGAMSSGSPNSARGLRPPSPPKNGRPATTPSLPQASSPGNRMWALNTAR